MKIRREMAADQIDRAREILGYWSELLREEKVLKKYDGIGNVMSEAKLPMSASAEEALGEYTSVQLRAELTAVAAMLEGIAST